MAEGARAFDGGRYIRALEQRIRALELAQSASPHAKTTIIGGAVSAGMVIPRLWIAGRSDWAGLLVSAHGVVEAGSCTVELHRSNQEVAPEGDVIFGTVTLTTTPSRAAFSGQPATAYKIKDGDWVRLVITAAAGCSNLSLSVNYVALPGR